MCYLLHLEMIYLRYFKIQKYHYRCTNTCSFEITVPVKIYLKMYVLYFETTVPVYGALLHWEINAHRIL